MNEFTNFEKAIVRELSCRLCLCNDVMKLKPLSAEVKRKLKRLFDIVVRTDDYLPKAICHDCLHQLAVLYLYTVKVDKTQKFLEVHRLKALEEKREFSSADSKMQPIIKAPSSSFDVDKKLTKLKTLPQELQQGDAKLNKLKSENKKKSAAELKFMEALTLDEFAKEEKLDKTLLSKTNKQPRPPPPAIEKKRKDSPQAESLDLTTDTLDPIVLIDGRPARQGAALDKQITLFYKMECCICHQKGFHFRSLMRHYKERHGVPGYVTCCDKKFHYFYPKKIIEHMAYHIQPNIFMCSSCHHNFQTSQALVDHQSNGGRSEGKILCPRCTERFPTYHELGSHIVLHRTDKLQCDYCGKLLKHHHRKKTINQMENVILCSVCMRTLRTIEKQEKENKEKVKPKGSDAVQQKYQKFKQAMGLSGEEEGSTD